MVVLLGESTGACRIAMCRYLYIGVTCSGQSLKAGARPNMPVPAVMTNTAAALGYCAGFRW